MAKKRIDADFDFGGTSKITGLPEAEDAGDAVSLETMQQYVAENGGGGTGSTVYTFNVATTQWMITHNRNRVVNVTVIIDGEEVDADISHSLDGNVSYVNFGSPQLGKAVIS